MRTGDGYPGQQAGQSGYPGGPATYPGVPSGQPGAPAGYPGGPSSQPSYPGGPASYPGGPASYPGGPASHPGSPASHPGGPGGQPPGPSRRAKPAWSTWWIAPFLGGALAVLVVFAILQLTVLRHPAGPGSPAASSPAAAAPKGMPAQVFPDALFKQLTKDLQANNEQGFLSLVAPSARPAVQTWWDNLQAIGFSTGLVMPTSKTDQVSVNSSGNGTATVLAGTHSTLDPVNNGKPDIPLESYQLGLHFSSPSAIGQITAWKPLGDDPWDQGGKLYVRKGTNVVVAGPAADSSAVDETLPIAQAAAAYDVGLVNHVNPHDLSQTGFVVFVSGNPTVRGDWFASTKQPSGWPPAFFGGFTAQLPGPGASADTAFDVSNVSDGSTGGARVVITPFEDQNGGTQHQETAELVHQFMLDILAASDQELIPGSPLTPVPSWAVEGFAVAVQSLYEENSSPTPDSYSFQALNEGLAGLPASYRSGTLPTSAELYTGSLTTEENWNDVAASVYAYIATKYGMNQLLAAADLMYVNEPDPFENVLKSNTKGTLTFYAKDTIESGWAAGLASPSTLPDQAGL
jgi:hypothetical protein